jgi:Fe/S biogenesis protein NfuA
VIGIHPERVAGDPQAVRWVVPAGLLPVGRVRSAPGRLGEMLCDGTLSDVLTEHTAVWMWLREGVTWAALGTRVQAALREALSDPDGCGPGDWVVDPAPGEVLQHVVVDALDGSVGDFIRSHGGSVTAERAGDDVVVTLGGACEHCPAAGYTLRLRLLGELRKRCPDLVEIDSDGRVLTLRLS